MPATASNMYKKIEPIKKVAKYAANTANFQWQINIVEVQLEYVLTLSRDRTRQVVDVVHTDNARASSAAANFGLTFLPSRAVKKAHIYG